MIIHIYIYISIISIKSCQILIKLLQRMNIIFLFVQYQNYQINFKNYTII